MVSTTTITFMAWLAFDCFSLHTNDVNSEDDYDGDDDNDNGGGEYKDRDDDSYDNSVVQ